MNSNLLRIMALAAGLACLGTASGSAQPPLILDPDVFLEEPPPAENVEPVGTGLLSPLPELVPGSLSPAALTYLVRMNRGGTRTEVELQRRIERIDVDGRSCWRVVDVVSTPGREAVDTFDLDAETLAPLRRVATGTGTIRISYEARSVTGEIGVGEETVEVDMLLEAPVVGDGPGLELTLAALPLRAGFTTAVRLFEPIEQRVRVMQLAVTGEEVSRVGEGTFPAWTVELTSLDGNDSGTATFSVMKELPRYVVKAKYRLPALVGGGVMTTELISATDGTPDVD
jgi:hypothetical protein